MQEMYLETIMILFWLGDTLSKSCYPARDWCTSCDDVTLNCIDVNVTCLTVNNNFRFAAISNYTTDVQFYNAATLGILAVETKRQFDHFCKVNSINIRHIKYKDQHCLKSNVKDHPQTSTPHGETNQTEEVSDFIGYIVWGGVACGVLIVFLIAVLALMLTRNRQSHGDINDSTR